MRRTDVVTLTVFAALLAAPVAARFAGASTELDENAAATPRPPLDEVLRLRQDRLDQLLAWTDEQVALRDVAVAADAALAEDLLGDSPNDDVVFGTSPWLFSTDELIQACDAADEQRQQAVRRSIAQVQAVARAAELELHLAFSADKSAIAVDELGPVPNSIVACVREADAFYASLEDSGTTVPHRAALHDDQAAGTQTFLRLDTHWAPAGARHLAAGLVRAAAPGLWVDGEVVVADERPTTGDLSRLLGRPEDEVVPRFRVDRDVEVTAIRPPESGHPDLRFYEAAGEATVDPTPTTLLHDSFMWAPLPLVMPFFADLTAVNVSDPAHTAALPHVRAADRLLYERVQRSTARTLVDADLSARLAMALAPRLPWADLDSVDTTATGDVLLALHLPPLTADTTVRVGVDVTIELAEASVATVGPTTPLVVRVPAAAANDQITVTSGRSSVTVERVQAFPLPTG